jgi:hypothetical protein
LQEQLQFRANEKVDLKLTEEGRELVFKSQMKKSPTEQSDITAFLFDHAVLLVRFKQVGKGEEVKAYRRVRLILSQELLQNGDPVLTFCYSPFPWNSSLLKRWMKSFPSRSGGRRLVCFPP